jgi:hypothetical protein
MRDKNKRTAHACENHGSAFLSRKPFFVTRQTPRAPDASHSSKPADFPFRCPHTWRGVKRLLGDPRRLSELISALYQSQPQKPAKCNPYKEFLHDCPPSTFSLRLARLATILCTPNHQTTKPPNHQTTKPPNHQTTKPPNHRGTEAQRHRGTEAQRCRGTEVQRCRGANLQKRQTGKVFLH